METLGGKYELFRVFCSDFQCVLGTTCLELRTSLEVTDGIMDSHGYVNIDRSAEDLCVWDFGLEFCYELDFC